MNHRDRVAAKGNEAPGETSSAIGSRSTESWNQLYATTPWPVGALVRTVTHDGLRLDGFWQPSVNAGSAQAVICVHGAASNFYAGGLWDELAQRFRQQGNGVLRVNTRGHDGHYVTRSDTGVVRMGAAYERVADATGDLRSWITWLREQGYARVVLVGHSLGAIKVLYAQAKEPSPEVQGIIALSAPRLSCALYQEVSPAFRATLLEARRRIQSGQGQSLIESQFPFPMLITAEGFVDKYGGEQYNVLTFCDQLMVRTGLVFGERETTDNPSFAALPEAFRQFAARGAPFRVELVPGADHYYAGCYAALGQLVEELLCWICS